VLFFEDVAFALVVFCVVVEVLGQVLVDLRLVVFELFVGVVQDHHVGVWVVDWRRGESLACQVLDDSDLLAGRSLRRSVLALQEGF